MARCIAYQHEIHKSTRNAWDTHSDLACSTVSVWVRLQLQYLVHVTQASETSSRR